MAGQFLKLETHSAQGRVALAVVQGVGDLAVQRDDRPDFASHVSGCPWVPAGPVVPYPHQFAEPEIG